MFLNLPFSPLIRQYAIVITANLSIFCVGLGLAWSSPVLVKLKEPVLGRPITEDEGSWLVSVGYIVGLIPTLLSGFLLGMIGGKNCIILATLPRIAGWILFSFGTELWTVMLGRSLAGISDAVTLVFVPNYASEISSKAVRGALGTVLQMCCSLGMLTMFCIGPFLDYFLLNQICAAIACLTALPLLVLPNSPYFLYSKGHKDKALDILTFLRGSTQAAEEEIAEYSYAQDIKSNKLELLSDKVFMKTIAIVCVFSAGAQLTGYNSIMLYMQTILESAKAGSENIRPEDSSVIVGFIQIFASFCSALVIDKYGRKPILITTLFGLVLGMVGLGIFFTIKVDGESLVGFINYLPLISVVLLVYCFNAGFGSLTWLLVTELFDSPTRGLGSSTGLVMSVLTMFLTAKYFPILRLTIGASVYWVFSIVCAILIAFVVFCIPETKGKSFAEIQEALGRRKVEKLNEGV